MLFADQHFWQVFTERSGPDPLFLFKEMKTVDLKAIDALARPAVDHLGLELLDVEWRREQGTWLLRVTIDRRPDQGYIDHDDCARVSRALSALFDVHEALPDIHYNLEVSSPGVDRPLKRPEHFERCLGKRARIRLRAEAPFQDPGDPEAKPRRNFVGTLLSVGAQTVSGAEPAPAEAVRLLPDGLKDQSRSVVLPLSAMEKANLIYEF